MRVFFETVVTVRRQHFSVRVNVDPFSLRLREQHFEIFQVMAGNHDERSFFQMDLHLMR